jgi:tetratricopeptide (TPR) repeat protein
MDIERIDAFIRAVQAVQQDSDHVNAFSHLKDGDVDGACEIWEKYHEKHPDDHVSAHHLAILHHSRAWELEQDGKCKQALKHWRTSHDYWEKVIRSDDFWAKLTRKMIRFATDDKGFDFYWDRFASMKQHLPQELRDENVARDTWDKALDHWFEKDEIPEWWKPFEVQGFPLGGVDLAGFGKVRKKLTEELARIHYSLVGHYVSSNQIENAKLHMKFIMESKFFDDIKSEIKRDLENRFLYDRDSVKKGHQFEEGIRRATTLLELLPENPAGLEFLIFSYNEWNFYLTLQNDLSAIERNMEKIMKDGYRRRLEAAKNSPDCSQAVSMSIQKELERINAPIVNFCMAKAADYSKLDFGRLSSTERSDYKRMLDNLIAYGTGVLAERYMDVARSYRKNIFG